MATNEILRFAETDTGTNLLTQSEYASDSQRPIGNQPGVARSKLVNKALRQASLIAAGLAEYIADNQANDITDALTPQNIADCLQAAITGALGVTPPQFDNDTSLATTAFVQRALGNKSTIGTNIATSISLGLEHLGGLFVFNGGSGTPFAYLPDISPINSTSSIFFYNTGSVAAKVQTFNGAQNIALAGRSNTTSIDVPPGGSLSLTTVAGAGEWFIDGGSVSTKYDGNFGASLATSGYQKLPSGLIIQWGRTGGGSDKNVLYPIAFPNGVFSVQATSDKSGANVQEQRTVEVGNVGNLTFFSVYPRYDNISNIIISAEAISWVAFGN